MNEDVKFDTEGHSIIAELASDQLPKLLQS